MPFSFMPDEPVREGILRLLQEQIDHGRAQLQLTGVEQMGGIHEARKTVKRLRAVLHLVRESIGEAPFQRENGRLRALSHRLAPLREAAALVELLEALAAEPVPEVFWGVKAALEPELEAVSAALLAEQDIPAQAAGELARIGAGFQELTFTGGGFSLLAGGLRRVYRQGRRRMARAVAAGDSPERYHDWRKRVKYLWHHLEILTPVDPETLEPLAAEVHHLSDLLGEAHDLAELWALIAAGPAGEMLREALPPLRAFLAGRQKERETAAVLIGAGLYAARPADYTASLAARWAAWRSDPGPPPG